MSTALRRFLGFMVFIWVGGGLVSLAAVLFHDSRGRHDLLLREARTHLAQILHARTWNARHGGVYVPVSRDTPPNPHLEDPLRDVDTPAGLRLTKINPAYMTRQISEIAREHLGVQFHLTSRSPIRPENAPFGWEVPWLDSFVAGSTEQSALVRTPEGHFFRYMVPLRTQQECLDCHGRQGHRLGDIRGGISIVLPVSGGWMDWGVVLQHVLAMMAGVGGILYLGGRLHRNEQQQQRSRSRLLLEVEERSRTEEALREARDLLELRVTERTRELSEANSALRQKINERAQVERALIMIYDEFYQLFNLAPDPMMVLDGEGHFLRVNQAFCRFLEREPNQILGGKCRDLLPCVHCGEDICPIRRIMGGEQLVELETVKQRADGVLLPCIVTTAPFREPDGSLIGAVQLLKDISEHKRAEEALARTAERLAASNRDLEDFAHVVSHDLQEPLVLIQAFSERLQRRGADLLPERCRQYLTRIELAARRMQALIQCLLLYARVHSRAQPFQRVDLNEILEGVMADLELRLEETGGRIEPAGALPVIEADILQMRQLFQNLLGNSLKYRRAEEPPVIRLWAERVNLTPGGHVRLVFQDNGVGFSREESERIFEMFERLPGSGGSSGTGIGLAICRRIVERHHGSIRAEGSPGSGARFVVDIPVTQVKKE